MNLISTLAIAMGAGWVSGINLYAAVATLGLLGRFAHLRLPGELDILTSWWIIGLAVALYLVEFVADKVPYVDSVWDAVHTFIRIPAGAVLAATAFGDFDRGVQVAAFLLGGGLALSAHGTKAGARAAINLSPEPASNIVASLTEDVIAVGSILLSVFAPFILFAVITGFVVVSFLMARKILRAMKAMMLRLREAFS
ncbi:MAG TPA: DUF4126 domain-containing protein [Pyrinomonadaceae bacterium]|nr:DUF4126 domain-containing protein [Pyrinomonadaceae bacterium]